LRVTLREVGGDRIDVYLSNAPAAYLEVKKQALEVSVNLLYDRVRSNLDGGILKKKSGELYDSIRKEVIVISDTSVRGRVWSDSPKASILERGGQTRPHEIVVKNALAMRFEMQHALGHGSHIVFAKTVNHPGSKMPAFEFMSRSLEDLRTTIRNLVRGKS
jgi:hypothetical protein